jgi:hypothetical protein
MKWSAPVVVLFLMGGCNTAPPPKPLPVPAPAPSTSAVPSPTPAPAPSPKPVVAPAGVNAGVAVFDRQTGQFTAQLNATTRFRSASLVKIFIAIGYLWDRGPAYSIATADQNQFQLMLRGSDDSAASYFYSKIGGEPALVKVFERLSLQDTKPPSAVGLKGWGSTTLSANDMVRTYRFLLETAPAGLRDAIMGHLHESTPCGTDHYFQNFGIPGAFGKPWSAKQGWWGFGDAPANVCTPPNTTLAVPAKPVVKGDTPALMSGRVLHTTGTVGENDRVIVAVLTQYPSGTGFLDAYATITQLTRSLPVPL